MPYEHMPCTRKTQAGKSGKSGKPTERQAEFIGVFSRLIEANGGVSPSLAELAEGMGVNVPTVQGFVRRLTRIGILQRRAGKYRSLSLAAKGERKAR